jgi:F-type H+-transporting ATPase subunit delta
MVRGASAEALAELGDQLGTRTLADSATLGEELLGVARVLRSEAALRRVATDAAVEGDAKAALVGNVFGTAWATGARRGPGGRPPRWTALRDLAEVLERLGVRALVQSAGTDGTRVSDELFAVRHLVDSRPGAAHRALRPDP